MSVNMTKESPSSSGMGDNLQTYSADEAVIPVYSVSDSDEDRANALMRNMSQSLSTSHEVKREAHSAQQPDIIETDGAFEVVDISSDQMATETPSIKVSFMNTDIGRKYRHDIEEFFHTLMTTENLSKDRQPLPKVQSRPNLKTAEGGDSDSGVVDATTVIGSISVSDYLLPVYICGRVLTLELYTSSGYITNLNAVPTEYCHCLVGRYPKINCHFEEFCFALVLS